MIIGARVGRTLGRSPICVHVPHFGGCQGRRTGVGVTTVSNLLMLGGWVTKGLRNGDKK